MKKLLILNLCFISKVVLSEDEVVQDQFYVNPAHSWDQETKPKKSILKRTDTQWTEEEQNEFRKKSLAAQEKQDEEDKLLESSLKARSNAINYVGDPERGVAGHIQKEWRNKKMLLDQKYKDIEVRKKLNQEWEKYSKNDQSERTSKLTFGDDVVDRGPFNPRDVTTWDLNRLKKITVDDMRDLSADQVKKLLQKSDYLKSLKHQQLQAINTNFFVAIPDELLQKILNDEEIKNKFNEQQILAMNFKVHIDDLKVGQLKLLFKNPEILDVFNSEQIHKINPEILSKVLYNKLSVKLSSNFIQKLSDQQVMQLFNDHVAWGLKSLLTSFKSNFTTDALVLMQERVDTILYEERQDKLIGG